MRVDGRLGNDGGKRWGRELCGSKLAPEWIKGPYVLRTCDSWVAHMSAGTDVIVNTVVNGFQAVTCTATVADAVVAEREPCVDTGQEIVGLVPDV